MQVRMSSTNLFIIRALSICVALFIGVLFTMRMFKKKRKISEFGISILYKPPNKQDSSIDIIFVHGIGVDSVSAWSENDFSWPEQELPKSLKNIGIHATIAAYDYDSTYRTPEYLTRRTLFRQAEGLIEALAKHKGPDSQRRTLFVCHSLGGLLVKNALVNGRSSNVERFRQVSNTTAGILFLDTPHCTSPADLAERLCSILKVPKDSDEGQDLSARSTTLACNLERFKPFADSLLICDFSLKANTTIKHESSSEKSNASIHNSVLHKQYLLGGESSGLCRFSESNDHNLKEIIKCIGSVSSRAIQMPLEQKTVKQTIFGYDQVGDLGLDKPLSERCLSIRERPLTTQYHQLTKIFRPSATPENQIAMATNPPKIWSIGILEGGEGCGKTYVLLQYVDQHREDYGSILWLNATNKKSLELSFQAIARRMMQTLNPDEGTAARQLGLEGINLNDKKDLLEEEFYIVFSVVTEWLVRPRAKRWLLVLDGISANSSYPDSDIWTCRLGQKEKKPRSWASILPLLPSTANGRGDIIISTRDSAIGVGCEIVQFPDSKASYLPSRNIQGDLAEKQKANRRVHEWWEKADGWQRDLLETIQILSDKDCCDIPMSLLQPMLPKNKRLDKLQVPGLTHNGSLFHPSEALIEQGTHIFIEFSTASISQMEMESIDTAYTDLLRQSLKKAVARSWEILAKTMEATRSRDDLIFAWDFEAQTIRNIQAALRRCETFLPDEELTEVFSKTRSWANLGTICESHAQFETAARLYQLERGRDGQGMETYFSLELDCARVYEHCQHSEDAEAMYKSIFSENYCDIPLDKREAACRQFASFRASQSRFGEAIDKLIEVLAFESPFGEAVDQRAATGSVMELAGYLRKAGNKSAASALLQRKLVSLEEKQGRAHPKTLAVMEALSITKLEEGELQEARSLLSHVLDHQKQRLGAKHPITVRCASKLAATWDLQGETQVAKEKYLECLDVAAASLGPHHPVVSGIRDDFALFLLAQGSSDEAHHELDKLEAEAKDFKGLYPKGFVARIHRLKNPKLDMNDIGPNGLCRRSTLGARGLFVDSYGEDDYGNTGTIPLSQ